MNQNKFESIKIICLLTSVRGGSKLFQSLTDSHSAIISFPRTFRYTQFTNATKSFTIDQVADFFCAHYPRFFSGLEWAKKNILDRADQLGPNQNETFIVDAAIFKKYFKALLDGKDFNEKNVFLALHFAYAKARNINLDELKYILYHVHDVGNMGDISQCLEFFGKERVKFVFTTRHPIDGLNSCFEWMLVQNMLSPLNTYDFEVLEFTAPIFKHYPDIDLRVVALERLRHNRQPIMENFCSWLGIPFENVVLRSTIHGKSWKGNARKPLGDALYSDAQLYQPQHFLEKNDLKILFTFFPKRLGSFGIRSETFKSKGLAYMRMFLPTYQEYLSFKKSLSPFFWVETYKKAKTFKQNFFYLLKIGNPLVLIYFYFARVAFYLKNIGKIDDIPCHML